MKLFRFILGILGLLTTPTILILAWSNPLLKEYGLFYIMAWIWLLIISLFVTESFLDKVS
jgi:hypothetical protein